MNPLHNILLAQTRARFCAAGAPGRGRRRTRARPVALAWAIPAWAIPAWAIPVWALSAWALSTWAMPAWPRAVLPQGAQVVSGKAQVTRSGAAMTVVQGTDKAILDWQSFDIGKDQRVTFQQPGAAAVALNRVVGGEASAIHGALDANGRVFLVNPNGVLFGPGARVDVGALVASTLDISNHDFLRSHYQFNGRGSSLRGASVRNLGRITAADGAAVALLGGSVSNQGTIAARLGTVALAAGNQVTLDFAGDGLLGVQVTQSAIDALAENHQLLQADGGRVLITAQATDALLQTVLNNTGSVQARTVENHAGAIVLSGGAHGGTARVAGTLDASAAAPGTDGGFVHTTGAKLRIEAGTRVTTRAALGKSGTWRIDPAGLAIEAGTEPTASGALGAQTLGDNLVTGNVVLATASGGAGGGHLRIDAPLAWSRHRLTLDARGSIELAGVMSVSGSGTLALNHGGTAGDAARAPVAGTDLAITGRVDFAHAGAHLLSINGHAYTVIDTLDALQAMAGALDGKYALGRSIDASTTAVWHGAAGFVPIGREGARFSGVFDGLGHTIDGLVIHRPAQDHVGLFGYGQNATLRNVGLVDGSVRGGHHTGALIGTNQASGGTARIFNVHAIGKTWGGDFTGGLVGHNHADGGTADISHAYALGQVAGRSRVGGLVGHHGVGGTRAGAAAGISHAHAGAQVSGQSGVGGLVGTLFAATGAARVTDAYATGAVSADRAVGGLAGVIGEGGGSSRLAQVYSTGQVAGTRSVGGLIGMAFGGADVRHAFWNPQTSGQFSRGRGQALTTAQMFDASQWVGFDFDTVWGNAGQRTTPYLRGLGGNQVFRSHDLPWGDIGVDNRPALHPVRLEH